MTPTNSGAERTAGSGATYRRLEASRIVETVATLSRRVGERFPGSGLGNVSLELLAIANETTGRLERLRQPIWPLRIGAGVLVLAIFGGTLFTLAGLRQGDAIGGAGEAIQLFESLVQDIVFIGIAVFFLASLEPRVKRRTALRGIHELRSIAHIVDMHQLTKDPEHFLSPNGVTASSPQRTMTRFELARYLDYCSELLSLTSKLAALYIATFDDPVVIASVNEVVTLTTGLSGKIWQKIMILDTSVPQRDPALEH